MNRPKKKIPTKNKPVQEHGVETACYNNLPFQHPVLICLCGYYADSGTNWEEAGADFDEHLSDVAKKAEND